MLNKNTVPPIFYPDSTLFEVDENLKVTRYYKILEKKIVVDLSMDFVMSSQNHILYILYWSLLALKEPKNDH